MSWYPQHNRHYGNASWMGQHGGRGGRWACPMQECKDALKKIGRGPWVNNNSEKQCGFCREQWVYKPSQQDAKLEEAKLALQIRQDEAKKQCSGVDAEGFQLSKTQLKKQKAAAAKEVAAQAVLDAAVEEPESDTEEEVPTVTLDLPVRFKELAKALCLPRDLDDDWAAEAVVAKFAPKNGAEVAEKIRLAIAENKLVLGMDAAQLGAPIDKPAIVTKIQAQEKALKKAEKEATGAALNVKQLAAAKQEHADSEAARVLRADTATVTAAEGLEEIEQIALGHITAWEKMLEQHRAKATTRDTAWAELRQTLSERAVLVQAAFDAEILLAHAKAGTVVDLTAPPAAQTVDLSLADALAEVAQLKADKVTAEADRTTAADFAVAETAELIGRIRKLEALAHTAAQPALPPLALAQCAVSVQWLQTELPQLQAKPDRNCKRLIVHLGSNVAAWARNGQVPLTFKELLVGVPPEELAAALSVLKELTGHTIWLRMFGADNDVALEHYVPFQLGSVLLASLQMAEVAIAAFIKADAKLDVGEKAQGQFGAFFERDQKHRSEKSGPYATA